MPLSSSSHTFSFFLLYHWNALYLAFFSLEYYMYLMTYEATQTFSPSSHLGLSIKYQCFLPSGINWHLTIFCGYYFSTISQDHYCCGVFVVLKKNFSLHDFKYDTLGTNSRKNTDKPENRKKSPKKSNRDTGSLCLWNSFTGWLWTTYNNMVFIEKQILYIVYIPSSSVGTY